MTDDYYELFKDWSFETYPAEGDLDALAFCRQFAEEWNGHTALGLVCPHCRAPGMTGLMVCVYKALLPRIRAQTRDAVYVSGVELSMHSGMPAIYRPMAAVMYPAGLLVIDDLAMFPIQSGGQDHLLRLLRFRQTARLPTFFIGESLQVQQERLTPEILEVLLAEAVVREVYGPNLHLLMGARHHPEQAKEYPDLYDAYEYLRKPGQKGQ